MRRHRFALASLVVLFLATLTRADDWPADLVRWQPIAANPVFTGSGGDAWDQKIRERGWILVEDGLYHLWYTGYNTDKQPVTMRLGHATSPDGLHWLRDVANPLALGSWVEDMCVVHVGDTYYMFAEGEGDVAHLLTAKDPVHWQDQGPLDIRKTDAQPITAGPRGTPTVYVEGSVWNLLYERGDKGIWLATSRDRKVWTNVQDDPVLKMGPEPYDLYAVAMNQVLEREGYYYATYHANAHMPWKDWSTCLARSKDLVHWEKYPKNPIVNHNWSSAIMVDGPGGHRLYTMHPEVRVFVNPKESEK